MNLPRQVQTLDIYVSCLEKEGPFLKIWGQADQEAVVYVQNFLIQNHHLLMMVSCEALQKDMLVAVLFKDNKYYRARILNIDNVRAYVEVFFIDYGYREGVPVITIRSIENLATQFLQIKPQAAGFILAETTCLGGVDWKDEIFLLVCNEILHRSIQCQLVAQAAQHFLIRAFIDRTDISTLLVARRLMAEFAVVAQQAVLTNMSIQKQSSPMQMIPTVTPAPVQIPIPTVVPTVVPTPTPTTQLNTYRSNTLEPNRDYNVFVSYVQDGPSHFWVQLQQNEEALKSLIAEINDIHNHVLLSEFPLPGTICFARSEEDNSVCRAVVTNEVDNMFKVFYVDFGNYEKIPYERLYQIPFKYVLPKVMATRMSLNGIEKSTVTMDMKVAFKSFVDERLLKMRILPSNSRSAGPTIPKCDLWDPETNMKALDEIMRAAQHAYPEPLTLNRGFTQPIKVSYVYSCSRFYVQLTSKEADLVKLMEDLQVACQCSDAIREVKLGLPCCALFESDQLWYRSEIVDVVDKENVKVKYIDYGNEEVVPVIHLRMVGGNLLTVLRPQAIECCLNGYQNMSVDESRDALLEDLILEKNFTMKVSEMHGKKALVELIDSHNYNVASLLLDRIAAAKSQVSAVLVQAGMTVEHRRSDSDIGNSFKQNMRRPAREHTENRPNERSQEKTWSRNDRNENRSFEKTSDKPWRNERKDRERQNDENSNDESDAGSWAQNNKGYNRENRPDREDRRPRSDRPTTTVNDRFEKHRGNENRNNNFRNKQDENASWGSPVKEPVQTEDDWGGSTSSPAQHNSFDSRKPRDDNFGYKKRFDRENDSGGGWAEKSDRGGRNNREEWKSKDRGEGGGYGRNNYKERSNKFNDDSGDWGHKNDGFKKDYKKDGSDSGSEQGYRKGPRTSSRNEFGEGRRFNERSNNSFGNSSQNEWSISDVSSPIDAAATTDSFKKLEVVGTEGRVIISWFHNPGHFYCQLEDTQSSFRTLMQEIQQFYKNRKPESAVIGSPIVGLFPEDNVLYRAQVLEVSGGGYKVLYVDFGNVEVINKVWPIEKKFIEMPAQALCCALTGIGPSAEKWPDASAFNDYFAKETFTARFVDQDENRVYLELWDNQKEISQVLVEANLAVSKASSQFDISLLLNQQFRVILKSVNNLKDIVVTLENGQALKCSSHNIDMASESFEHVLKEHIEKSLIIYVDNIVQNEVLDATFYDNDGNKLVILTPDDGALDNVDPLCTCLVYNSTFQGYVSHANETSVFIQATEYADQMTFLLDKMYNAYESLAEEGSSIIPEEGFIYAVHSTDGNWYRGRVDSFDDEKATVFYVDYGNNEEVTFSQIRELKSEFNIPNMMCLQVVVSADSDSATSFLEKDVVASIYYGESGWEGTVKELPASQQTQLTSEFVEEITETITEVGTELTEENLQEVYNESTVEACAVLETQEVIVKGTPVIVSHIDSPTEFYVQFAESSDALVQLQQQLQDNVDKMPVLESISVGGFCAAPYSVDLLWYRAEVLDCDEDITTVRFIDFGNTDVIDNAKTQLKTLPTNLLSLACFATRCSLKLKAIEEEWSQAAIELFEEMSNAEPVGAEFIIQDEKTNIVELYSEGKSVKEALLELNFAVPCEIVSDTKTTCFVSHLNSPSEFWVQMENCVDELEWIAEQLSRAEQFAELEDMSPGTLCAALFPDDEMWYRGRILSNTVAGIELLFIDYGNSSVSSSLRQLPEDLVLTAPLAQKCCLQRPKGIPYWTREMQDNFAEISAEGQTIFTLKKISTGETAVVDLVLNGENIVQKILPTTEPYTLTKFESLNQFAVDKNGKVVENVKLEPLPGMEWDGASGEKFLEMYPEGTVFQVELLQDGFVRLYEDKLDIRPELGGVKIDLNLSNSKTDSLAMSEDQVIDHNSGGDNIDIEHSNNSFQAKPPTEGGDVPVEIIQENLSELAISSGEIKEEFVEEIEDSFNVEPETPTEDIDTSKDSASDSGHHSEQDNMLKSDEKIVEQVLPSPVNSRRVRALSGKIVDEEKISPAVVSSKPPSPEKSRPASAPSGQIVNEDENSPAIVSRPPTPNDNEVALHFASSLSSQIKSLPTDVPILSDSEKTNNSIASQPPSPAKSRSASALSGKISHDDKILPAFASRPHTPSDSEKTIDIISSEPFAVKSRPASALSGKIVHDDKILPAVLSRPHTPSDNEKND